jgi:DNA-binding NarL/FixJ family response regulator
MTTTTLRPPGTGTAPGVPGRTQRVDPFGQDLLGHGVPPPARAADVDVRVSVEGGDTLTRAGVVALLHESAGMHAVPGDTGVPADIALVVLDAVTRPVVERLRRLGSSPRVRLVLLVGEVSTEGVAIAVQAGAVGLLRKRDVTRDSLGQLVRSVAAGDAVVPPDLLSALLPRRRDPGATPGTDAGSTVPRMLALAGLNDREIAVLALLGEGADTREIAHRLCYSERTVKTVIQDIIRRFGLRNRAHAVGFAVRHGLI